MLIYKTGMTDGVLGELEHLVLLAIVRIGPDSYGVPIVDDLERHTRRRILRPSVYLALKRLEDKGLIRSRMGKPEARRGGRARRHFAPTAAGLRGLRDSQQSLPRLWNGAALRKAKLGRRARMRRRRLPPRPSACSPPVCRQPTVTPSSVISSKRLRTASTPGASTTASGSRPWRRPSPSPPSPPTGAAVARVPPGGSS